MKKAWGRKEIFTLLNKVYPTYSIGQHYKHDEKPYIVLKAMQQSTGIDGSQLGCHQYYNILCYVPDTSIASLDIMVKRISDMIKPIEGVEIAGTKAEDFHETEIGMYMRYLEIRVPKEV